MTWLYINDKITRRGIAKGLVNIQEDFNKSILEVEKQTIKAKFMNKSNNFKCRRVYQKIYDAYITTKIYENKTLRLAGKQK